MLSFTGFVVIFFSVFVTSGWYSVYFKLVLFAKKPQNMINCLDVLLLPCRWSLQASPAGQMSPTKAASPAGSGSLGTGWKWPLTIACLALGANSAFPSVRQKICFGFHYWKKLMQSMWTLLLMEIDVQQLCISSAYLFHLAALGIDLSVVAAGGPILACAEVAL